ncbi:vWA domain-containing protein [Croceivirga thetidis]|uniref:VWA domain-containing protein n=1 Tax=Croceivirga thetidis TaxID=2721623 RepID=A0ABX1GRK9_9FLAO|nr:vWA domain-containing protein [Croceivirga thetidis]NKI32234.1 VWA domain-containing protein [Croceivirga thetidis]
MSTQSILLIILATIVALGLSVFQYFFKSKRTKLSIYLAFLRFLSWFTVLLLLINPKVTNEDLIVEKPNLVLLVDNSRSIEKVQGAENVLTILQSLSSNNQLNERFAISRHFFSNGLTNNDSLNFDGDVSDMTTALRDLSEVYGSKPSAIVMLTDGNQNVGADFEFQSLSSNVSIFPVVVGDTTKYEDVYISQVNTNRYTFMDNQFPFEVAISYTGTNSVTSELQVNLDNKIVFRERFELSRNNNSKTIEGLLKSTSVGLKNLIFKVVPIASEKNIQNNEKQVAIEVIDEQTKIAVVSSIAHPDLGVLKKSIESNEQRSVVIKKPIISNSELDTFDFFILYQPNRQFENIFNFLANKGVGSFIITGTDTDWTFLNSAQNFFNKKSFNQSEDVIAVKNQGYSVFDLSSFDFSDYPPLKSQLGEYTFSAPQDIVLLQRIRGVNLETPLLSTFENNGTKNAVLFGENIWQWRMQTFRQNRDFEVFDNFMGQLIRYLSDTEQRSRLELDYEPIFSSPSTARIGASYFDETYTFKSESNLVVSVKKTGNSARMEIPMILRSNQFEADLSNLENGEYAFTVTEINEGTSKSGKFKILDFDIESQVSSANDEKLKRTAERNNGSLYYPSQIETLIQDLVQNDRYIPVQKSIKNVVSLIDFKWLLGLLVLSLTLEWFIRKYNGLL